ncbi:MAG: ammonia-forming cytochrome c nitrite reductase subunit c552 [Planctomyces sp.]|nr:ammonia-forming cytochrome c nitrite reductase subunit c552 [Planctomyces sp.]
MPADASNPAESRTPRLSRRGALLLGGLFAATGLIAFAVTGLLVTIFEHRQEARVPFVRTVEVNEVSSDSRPWGANWPYQHDTYSRTVDNSETEFGGSSAMPASKLDEHPWLRRMYAGYAFSIDYREARGHAYMLYDQEVTERVTQRKQAGACLHCHASVIPMYRRLGLEAEGRPADAEALGAAFDWPAVMKGFELAGAMDYAAAHAELVRTPDSIPGTPRFGEDPHDGGAHPVGCLDCHDPASMKVRVTRPGFILGIAALAESDDHVPHLPSIERWRAGRRDRAYDPNVDASRQEMRSYVCGQCHVEYYCASRETLFFPWSQGLKVEQMEAAYDAHVFPDGTPFYDYEHGETGARVYKAQHPEFELWSQGVHARSGVSCADCHMPYERQGAMKVSSHWVRSPMLNINNACQTCHNVPESELREKVDVIQNRTKALVERAAVAMTDMLDAIRELEAAGASPEELAPIFELQKKAMWRLDFISSENSLGFHADQEAARILGESIDYSRQAQARALRHRAPEAPESQRPVEPVQGVTPAERPAAE